MYRRKNSPIEYTRLQIAVPILTWTNPTCEPAELNASIPCLTKP